MSHNAPPTPIPSPPSQPHNVVDIDSIHPTLPLVSTVAAVSIPPPIPLQTPVISSAAAVPASAAINLVGAPVTPHPPEHTTTNMPPVSTLAEDNHQDDEDDDELQIVQTHITKKPPPRPLSDDIDEIVIVEEASAPARPRQRTDSDIEVVSVNPVNGHDKNHASNVATCDSAVEPAKDTKCGACGQDIPADAESLVVARCRHTLCVECAIRSVCNSCVIAEETPTGRRKRKKVPPTNLIFNAAALSKNPMCVVPRCRAPLSEKDASDALALASADKCFEQALKSFHAWVENGDSELIEDEDTNRYYGPSHIQLPEFTPEMAKAALKQPVSNDELVGDDFEGAYQILWEWDNDYVADDNTKKGCWTCLACGEYVPVAQNNNGEMEDAELMEIDDGIPEHPLYPHCDKARAYALMESINKLSKVGEEKSDKTKGKKSTRKTRSKSKRYRTAKSVSSSKRQRTTSGFAKGTGYAGKAGAEWKGASAKMLDNTRKVDKAMAYWLGMTRCYIVRGEAPSESWPCFIRVLLRECKITEVLSKILINESIMDVGQRVAVYVAALRVVTALNDAPSLRLLVAEPCENGRSLADLVQSLSKQAALLSNGANQNILEDETKLLITQIRKSIRGINRYNLLRTKNRTNGFELRVSMNPKDYHGLADVDNINKTNSDPETNNNNNVENVADVDADEIEVQEDANKKEDDGVSEERKQKYIEVMKELQFATVPGLMQASSFRKEAQKRSASEVGKGKGMRRVVSEVSSLFSSLPVSWSSAILVRVDEDRYDFLRACMFGPEDTPYENGVFMFDIFLPPDYPESPPKFRFLTTGGGRARFNPNLYSNGKVCLSILNTWQGPAWSPASTLLQVLVSIQSLILVPNPYFNEPGFEKMMNTAHGKTKSKQYNIDQYHNTINHAMLDTIRKPFAEFKVAIDAHFRLKRPTVEKVINSWLKESNEYRSQLKAKINNNSTKNGKGNGGNNNSNSAGALGAFAQGIGALFGNSNNPAAVNNNNSANGGNIDSATQQALFSIDMALHANGGLGFSDHINGRYITDMTPLVDKMKKLLDKLDGIEEKDDSGIQDNKKGNMDNNDKIIINIAGELEDENEEDENNEAVIADEDEEEEIAVVID